jgi:large subunit ribosomal protein L21e
MVKASKGLRARTRKILAKSYREKGLAPITRALQKFSTGEKACIKFDPSVHKGMPHPKFHGLTGTIVGKQGRAYLLKVRTGKKFKFLLVTPEHLRKLE